SLILAPAAGRSEAGMLPSDFRSPVSAPAFPKYLALLFSNAAGVAHPAKTASAAAVIRSRSSISGLGCLSRYRRLRQSGGPCESRAAVLGYPAADGASADFTIRRRPTPIVHACISLAVGAARGAG